MVPPPPPATHSDAPITSRLRRRSFQAVDVLIAIAVLALAWLGATATSRAAPTPHRADLRASKPAATSAPSMLTAGANGSWSFTVGNVGTHAAKPSIAIALLSRDASRGHGDVRLGSTPLAAIAVGHARRVTVSLHLPAGTAAGSYHLVGCVLPHAGERQLSGANDCAATTGLVMVMAAAAGTGGATNPGTGGTTTPGTGGNPPLDTTIPAPVLATIAGGSSGTSTTPTVHGSGAPAGATITLFRTATCTGSPIGTASAIGDGTFDVAPNGTITTGEVTWGTTSQLAVTYSTAAGTSQCSNALPFTHTGVTISPVCCVNYGHPASVSAGTPVRFVSANAHPPEFDSVPAGATTPTAALLTGNPGNEYRFTPTTAGTYAFQCRFHGPSHGGAMQDSLTVT